MTDCPHCHQAIDAQAIACPFCGTTLKAYGHPGIPLHRATGKEFLCQTCTYDADDTCTFPQRPYATECTLYNNSAQTQKFGADQKRYPAKNFPAVVAWMKQRMSWLVLLGVGIVSLLLALWR